MRLPSLRSSRYDSSIIHLCHRQHSMCLVPPLRQSTTQSHHSGCSALESRRCKLDCLSHWSPYCEPLAELPPSAFVHSSLRSMTAQIPCNSAKHSNSCRRVVVTMCMFTFLPPPQHELMTALAIATTTSSVSTMVEPTHSIAFLSRISPCS